MASMLLMLPGGESYVTGEPSGEVQDVRGPLGEAIAGQACALSGSVDLLRHDCFQVLEHEQEWHLRDLVVGQVL